MGEKNHEGRTWPFGHGGHGNQNPRLNPRNGASDGGWEVDNGGNQNPNGGNTGTTATYRPAHTAQQTTNPTANGPDTTQRQQTNYPTQAPAPGQPTYAQGDNGGQRTQMTQPDRGQPAHTTMSDATRSMTVVLGETTFATRYTDYDTLAIDTHAPTFSSGPLPTSGAGSYNNNNLNSASNNQQGGSANGATNFQSADLDGGLGGGIIAGIIVGVVLVLVISLVALFFHRKRKLARRGNNSPYGKHHPEEASSSRFDNGLAATVGAGAAAVGARSGGGGHGQGQAGEASTTVHNTPSASQQQQQPPSMKQTNNNSQYLVPASSSSSRAAAYTSPRPAPPPPPSSSHSSNFSLSMITPPPTHISSAFAPGAVSPISTVSPAVMGPPSPLLSDEEKEIGILGHRRPSIESVSTFSVHSAMMTASQINWPMPPSVASTSSPSVPLTKTPSRPVPVPAPHYVDFEEQGRTVVRINRESLTGGIGKAR